MRTRHNPAAAARAALVPHANALMREGVSPPDAWRIVLGVVQAGEPVAASVSLAAPASSPAPRAHAQLESGDLARELHREAEVIARERAIPLSQALLVAGGLPAGAARTPAPRPRWWADSAALDAEAKALQRATGRTFGECLREVAEGHAQRDRQAAAATFRERQGRENVGDQVAARMGELLAGKRDHASVRAALLTAGRELAGAAR